LLDASVLTGEALLAAQDENLQPLLDRLAAAAEGQDGIRAEGRGNLAGGWLANPEGRIGHELIAAGLLILAGGTDRGVIADRHAGRLRARHEQPAEIRTQPTQPAEQIRESLGAISPLWVDWVIAWSTGG
jgi:hypothetical protein